MWEAKYGRSAIETRAAALFSGDEAALGLPSRAYSWYDMAAVRGQVWP